MVRAYYYDDDNEGHQTLPHDSGEDVSLEQLRELGVLYWRAESVEDVDRVAKERGYKNRDEINVTKAGLGELYETKIKSFFEEHLHEDEEIRYILDGSGYFDVRGEKPHERWIRIALEPKDLLVLPAGIFHRFTLDQKNAVRAMRLFQDEPKWVPHNRSTETEQNPYHVSYLQSIKAA